MCEHCDHNHSHDNSGFIFGLLIGAIVAAVVAIVIYKNDKSDILSTLQSKLTKFFNDFVNPETPQRTTPHKKPVIIPEATRRVIAAATPKPITKSKPRTFIKPKK